MSAAIDALLTPSAVAIVGASADRSRIGGRILDYAIGAGFEGALYPVNPSREVVQGLPAYATLRDLPASIDLSVIALPAPQVADAVKASADAGASAAVVFSAGFAETGRSGARLQDELRVVADDVGIRVLGPNCLGLYSARCRHFATFSSVFNVIGQPQGRVGLISQSGAFGAHILMQASTAHVGIGTWISTGNEMDLAVPDLIVGLAHDDEVDVITCCLEGVRDGRKFVDALHVAHDAGKPVVLMKVGTSDVGAAAAASHTASIAGSDRAFNAALQGLGVERVHTIEDLLDLTYVLSRSGTPRGNRLGIASVSGGVGVHMADVAATSGLSLPPLPERDQAKLTSLNPLASTRNPVDITAQALNDFSLVEANISALVGSGAYDSVVAYFTTFPYLSGISDGLARALQATVPHPPRSLFALVVHAPEEVVHTYERKGYLVFEDPGRAVRAIGRGAALGHRLRSTKTQPPVPMQDPPDLPDTPMNEAAAKALVARIGIPIPHDILTRSPDEAARAARHADGAVALKIVSADIAHKTDVGGVALDVVGEAAAALTYQQVVATVGQHLPDARIDGVLVSPMVRPGVDLIVGARFDETFGMLTVVGLGGVAVEVLQDASVRIGPVNVEQARRMLRELRGAALLDGVRGGTPADVDAAASAIAAFSRLVAAHATRISDAEINPLVVHERGSGVTALDVYVELRPSTCPTAGAHA